jgi:hypothetical protein
MFSFFRLQLIAILSWQNSFAMQELLKHLSAQ